MSYVIKKLRILHQFQKKVQNLVNFTIQLLKKYFCILKLAKKYYAGQIEKTFFF